MAEKISQNNMSLGDDDMFEKVRFILLELLGDKKIKEQVKSFIENVSGKNAILKEKDGKEITFLQKEVLAKETELKQAAQEISRKDDELEHLKVEMRNLQAEAKKEQDALKNEIKDANEKMSMLRKKYEDLDELERVYSMYESLPVATKTSMAGFVSGQSRLAFLASGMRDSRLETFWEFCKTEVQKSDGLQCADIIAELFIFFFKWINSFAGSSLYELYEPAPGDKFNDETMILSNSSKVKNGIVEKSILPGYTGKNSKKIVKKAIAIIQGE